MPPPRERRTTPLVIDIDGRQLSTSIDADSGTHYINCHRCGDSITLTITGHPRNFYNHINGNVCKRNSNLLRDNNPSQSSESIFHIQTSSHSESGYNNASPISNISGIISSFSNLHASSPNPTPAPEMLDSRVLRPQCNINIPQRARYSE